MKYPGFAEAIQAMQLHDCQPWKTPAGSSYYRMRRLADYYARAAGIRIRGFEHKGMIYLVCVEVVK